YIWSLLRTVNDDFFAVVDGKYPPPPEGVDGSQIENLRGLCGAIRHEFKKCFTPAPVLKQKRSAWIDRDCWTWKTIDGVTYIRFTTLEKGERIELRLKGVRAFPLRKGRVLDGKTGKAWNKGAAMGILVYTPQGFFFDVGTPLKVEEHVNALGEDADKAVCRSYDQGVTETLMDDGGYAYGEGFREVLSRSSESFTARHSERQKFEALARNTDDPEKKANVIENNLGRERYEAFLFRVKQSAADFVNRALNDAVRKALSDGVDWLVLENLRHAFQFGEGLPLGIKRVFVWWLHGFIIKRLLFKASKHGLKVALVPSAYSSQGCPSCFYTYYGNRRGDHFKCQACKSEFHSDRVGAVNLLHRLHSSHWWPDMTVDQSWRAARLDYEEECARRGTTPLPEKRRPRSGVKRTKSSGTPSQKTNRNA
ncbi:transposase, partial [Sutterella sp.]|uniref:transposase n=1 Tax=Sutterella sp. TaxID=1981025 RepID=UPI0026DEE98F